MLRAGRETGEIVIGDFGYADDTGICGVADEVHEAEAEKLKAAAMERAKKRNAQWGRFMKTFASGGPKISIKHRASKKQVMPSVDILSFYSQFHRLWH